MFEKCEFCQKNEILKMWILWNMIFWKCEKWDFEGMNFMKSEIIKVWIIEDFCHSVLNKVFVPKLPICLKSIMINVAASSLLLLLLNSRISRRHSSWKSLVFTAGHYLPSKESMNADVQCKARPKAWPGARPKALTAFQYSEWQISKFGKSAPWSASLAGKWSMCGTPRARHLG